MSRLPCLKMMPPEAMVMSCAYAASDGYVWIWGPTTARVRACIDVHGPCCHWRPNGCPWSRLPPEAMLTSVGCATSVWPVLPPKAKLISVVWAVFKDLVRVCSSTGTGGHIHGLYCLQKTYRSPWFVPLADCKKHESYFCNDIDDCRAQLRKRHMDGFCGKSLPPPPATA